jgi:hypothetical protein
MGGFVVGILHKIGSRKPVRRCAAEGRIKQ